jgi:hypothetical protein
MEGEITNISPTNPTRGVTIHGNILLALIERLADAAWVPKPARSGHI